MPALTSLRARLLALLFALAALAAAAIGGITYRAVLAEGTRLFDYQLRQMALSLRDQGAIGAPAALDAERFDVVVQVWAADGALLYSSHAAPLLPPQVRIGYSDIVVGGRSWRAFSVTTPTRVIQVAQPEAVRRELAAEAAWRSVRPLLLATPVVALALWWLVGVSLRPLAPLAEAVRRRRADSLQPLSEAGLPAEIAPLVSALNGLLARLKESFDAQRAFVADAAHELRSPLTALKLQLDVLKGAADDDARRAAEADLRAGVQRAQRLVEQLLALARAEPGGAEAPLAAIDLAEVARQAVADAVPLARAEGADLALEAPGAVPARGDAAALRIAVRNLVDNALRYGGPAARVRVQVEPAGTSGGARVVVDDGGVGVPAAERERLFDRFVRREGEAGSGSGLGLAIVRTIARRHGGEVTLEDAPLGGLRAVLALPPP